MSRPKGYKMTAENKAAIGRGMKGKNRRPKTDAEKKALSRAMIRYWARRQGGCSRRSSETL